MSKYIFYSLTLTLLQLTTISAQSQLYTYEKQLKESGAMTLDYLLLDDNFIFHVTGLKDEDQMCILFDKNKEESVIKFTSKIPTLKVSFNFFDLFADSSRSYKVLSLSKDLNFAGYDKVNRYEIKDDLQDETLIFYTSTAIKAVNPVIHRYDKLQGFLIGQDGKYALKKLISIEQVDALSFISQFISQDEIRSAFDMDFLSQQEGYENLKELFQENMHLLDKKKN